MRRIIHNLRQKPEHHKKSIALLTSIVITGIVFVGWIASQIFIFSHTTVADAGSEEKSAFERFKESLYVGFPKTATSTPDDYGDSTSSEAYDYLNSQAAGVGYSDSSYTDTYGGYIDSSGAVNGNDTTSLNSQDSSGY